MARADRNILLRLKSRNPLNLLVSEFLAYIIRFSEFNNSLFQQINRVSKPTATRDLADLVSKGILPCSGKGPALTIPLLDTLLPPAANTAEPAQDT